MASSGKPNPAEPAVARLLLTPAQAVRESLRPYLPATTDGSLPVLLGYSGGIDSSVLLHLLATLATELPLRLHAVHVHHGLSPNADAWVAACEAQCRSLRIPLQVMRVDLAPHRALGVEGAARAARYAAFATAAQAIGCRLLLLAQHRDDQAETLLTQLLRGAGVAGLAAMPLARRLGELELLRPLLHTSRADIEAWARRHRLHWIEDESNQDQHRRR
ncbi:MAG: tRNA lysidine(34) synthetase TilS, partial [Betaproteobacteria bacterium]|nr:tRNA lysidine(34) synthetase TilS [Betaproteobacteria bacterium]